MRASILISLIKKLDLAVLKKEAAGDFSLVTPQWFFRRFGKDLVSEKMLRLEKISAFLENFLVDAKVFWSENKEGLLRSGLWLEPTTDDPSGENPLEAIAINIEGDHLLLIEKARYSYADKQDLLQKSRELSFDYKRLEKIGTKTSGSPR